MASFLQRFQRLQWQLTFTSVRLITLAGVCLMVVYTIVAFIVANLLVPQLVLFAALSPQASLAVPLFARDGRADPPVLHAWLTRPGSSINFQPDSLTVVDKQGLVLASTGPRALPVGSTLSGHFSSVFVADVRKVLAGGSDGLIEPAPYDAMAGVVPIKGDDNVVYAALVVDTGPDIRWRENVSSFWIYLATIFIGIAFYAIFAIVIGLIGGFGTARKFTRRFNRLALAAEKWSKGDFSTIVSDTSGDELGQLASQLNRMAEQLQNLLQARQQLATLEERNRLARDLHDSIKQQVFAISMQISAAKMLFNKSEYKPMNEHIDEAECLVRQAQKELTTLIHELRPLVLEGKALKQVIEDMLDDWTRRTAISVSFQAKGEQPLPQALEEALYRIVQESLSNIARHSQATHVQIELICEQDRIVLTIADNGRGFSPDTIQTSGVGLRSMRERMQALGGEIEIASMSEQGTTIIARCIIASVPVA